MVWEGPKGHYPDYPSSVTLGKNGESTDFIEALCQLELQFVLAIRENHGVWMPAGQQIEYTEWQEFDRVFTNGETETRWIREIVYGHRHAIRYLQITTDVEEQPPESSWFLMTNLAESIHHAASKSAQTEGPCPIQERPVTQQEDPQKKFHQHKWWDTGKGWKARLNNLRLLIQPYVSYCLILPWLHVFTVPFFKAGFKHLIAIMNDFKGFTPV